MSHLTLSPCKITFETKKTDAQIFVFDMHILMKVIKRTVMILTIWTNKSEPTAQTQIRLLLQEQSDQCLHYLPFCFHFLYALRYDKTTMFNSQGNSG